MGNYARCVNCIDGKWEVWQYLAKYVQLPVE